MNTIDIVIAALRHFENAVKAGDDLTRYSDIIDLDALKRNFTHDPVFLDRMIIDINTKSLVSISVDCGLLTIEASNPLANGMTAEIIDCDFSGTDKNILKEVHRKSQKVVDVATVKYEEITPYTVSAITEHKC